MSISYSKDSHIKLLNELETLAAFSNAAIQIPLLTFYRNNDEGNAPNTSTLIEHAVELAARAGFEKEISNKLIRNYLKELAKNFGEKLASVTLASSRKNSKHEQKLRELAPIV